MRVESDLMTRLDRSLAVVSLALGLAFTIGFASVEAQPRPAPQTWYVTGWRPTGTLPTGEQFVKTRGVDRLEAVENIGLTVWDAAKWEAVAAAQKSSGPLADLKTLTTNFDKTSAVTTVCFDGDCLPLADLRTLVADRKAASTSLVAYTQAQQTADAFKAAYVKAETDLGDCQSALGPWTKIGGAIAAGTSMIVDLPTLKAKIEAANPGKTIGVDWKIVDKGK